jgi:hypothetical protein
VFPDPNVFAPEAVLDEGNGITHDEFLARILGEQKPGGGAAFAAAILREYNFNPDEPRDERGRWTTGGSSGGDMLRRAPEPAQHPFLRNNKPGTRRQGRLLGGREPAWRGPVTPTHEFTGALDKNGDLHTYSWGNEPQTRSNPSRWFKDHPDDITAAGEALVKGGLVLGPLVGDESLNPYINEAYEMLHGAGKDSPSNHANGVISGNCKSESQRLQNLAKALQAADQAQPQDRERLRERAKLDAGLKPKPADARGVPRPGR